MRTNGADALLVPPVPDSQQTVRRGRDKPVPAREERQAARRRAGPQFLHLAQVSLPCPRVSHADALVVSGGGQVSAVRGEGNTIDVVRVFGEGWVVLLLVFIAAVLRRD